MKIHSDLRRRNQFVFHELWASVVGFLGLAISLVEFDADKNLRLILSVIGVMVGGVLIGLSLLTRFAIAGLISIPGRTVNLIACLWVFVPALVAALTMAVVYLRIFMESSIIMAVVGVFCLAWSGQIATDVAPELTTLFGGRWDEKRWPYRLALRLGVFIFQVGGILVCWWLFGRLWDRFG